MAEHRISRDTVLLPLQRRGRVVRSFVAKVPPELIVVVEVILKAHIGLMFCKHTVYGVCR